MDHSKSINALGVSVIICCYNSEERLPQTLKYLAEQVVDRDVKWEILIIDNASKDNTKNVAEHFCKKLFKTVKYQIIAEPEAGLSNARRRGINEAQFEYLLFCDDDNWLQFDYVQTALNIMLNTPLIGVVGGQNLAVYDTPPPKWFLENPGAFAIGKQSQSTGDITNTKGYSWGAGFVIKKTIFEKLNEKGFEFILSDRKGEQLTSGGDKELCLAVKKLGYRIYYDERLMLKHFMPSNRYDFDKFLKLSYQNGKAAYVYDAYDGKVDNYEIYFVTKTAETVMKLLLANITYFICQLFAKNSSMRYLSQRRLSYFSGKLHELLNIKRCKKILKTVNSNLAH